MSGTLLVVAMVAFGLFTGAAAGLLGVGGGILMVPFLTLAASLPQHAAEATSLLVGTLGLALRFGALGAAGGVAGALLALALPAHALRLIFALFLGAVAVRLIRDAVVAT